ncbi:MAG: hypothetical protein BIFFINMI_00407 [Phycisphaerae bacterium]|nr:hypothetical protein [Phycisphaerae bacterium]
MRWNWPVKIKLLFVVGGTLILFAAVGHYLIVRTDPAWPQILLITPQPFMAVVLTMGMAAVMGAVGGLLLSRDLPHVGWLIPASGWLGLAFVSRRLGNLLAFFPSKAEKGVPVQPPLPAGLTVGDLYFKLILELGALFLISMIACLLARWVGMMLPQETADPLSSSSPEAHRAQFKPGAPDEEQPRPQRISLSHLSDAGSDLLCTFVGTAVVGIVLYQLLVSSSTDRGQVIFALGMGFFIAALASHQVFPTRSPTGMVAAVPVTGLLCYLLSIYRASSRVFPADAPTSFGLPLPVDFMGPGLAAVIAAYLLSVRLLGMRQENLKRRTAVES